MLGCAHINKLMVIVTTSKGAEQYCHNADKATEYLPMLSYNGLLNIIGHQ